MRANKFDYEFPPGYKQLKKEEELALTKRMKKGDIGARDKLFYSCFPLVVSIAKKWNRLASDGKGRDLQFLPDAIQIGAISLLEKLERFDPEKYNTRLTTYVVVTVTRDIQRGMKFKRIIPVPQKIAKTEPEDNPARENVLTVGLSRDKIDREDQSEPPQSLEKKESRKRIRAALDRLKGVFPELSEILRMRYFEKKTLKEIGVEFGFSRERSRQKVQRAERMLNEVMIRNPVR